MTRNFKLGDHVRYGGARNQIGTIIGFESNGPNEVVVVICSDKKSAKGIPRIMLKDLEALN